MRADSRIAAEVRGLLAAVAFLTRLPVGRRFTFDGSHVAAGGVFFPVVGAGIGAAVGGITTLLAPRLSPLLAAAVALAAGAVLTGALHLDGLADTADGLGARTRERALEIMRDHNVGTYGVVALVLDLLIKASALAALAGSRDIVAIALASCAVARCGPVVLAAVLPYARPGDGAGSSLTRTDGWRAVAAPILSVAIVFGAASRLGLALAASAVVVTTICGLTSKRWIGGVTGDTLGATIELIEIVTLCTAVAIR